MKKSMNLLIALVVFVASTAYFFACKPLNRAWAVYDLACEYRPETQTVTGVVKVTVENPFAAPLDNIKFSLYPNAYRKNALYPAVAEGQWGEVYYDGESYGEISVSSVQGAVSWSVEGEDENILLATLEKPLSEGESKVLDIGFSTKLPYAKHRLGVTEKTVNLGGFYPVLCPLTEEGFSIGCSSTVGDPFASDCADYTVSITFPKEYLLAAAGERVEEKALESKKKYTMSLTNAREFVAVLSKDFRVINGEKAGRKVEYYYLSDEKPQETLSWAMDALAYYSSVFGEYAYGRYAIAETQLPFLGMEYTAFSMLCEGGTEKERLRALAHETAHQWWYAAVGSNQFENAWQDEGLAEYSAILFLDKKGWNREELVSASQKEYTEYAKRYLSALGWVDRRMTRPLVEYLSEYEYSCVSVHKAVVMFDELRKATGEKKFFAGLKKYYADCKFKRVKSEDLVGAFEKIGVDVFGFFDGFLNGKDCGR